MFMASATQRNFRSGRSDMSFNLLKTGGAPTERKRLSSQGHKHVAALRPAPDY
jgi:hypothetical protein